MNVYTLVGCGADKQSTDGLDDHELPAAKDLYLSGYFLKKREWAEYISSENWDILSAKYGVLHPGRPTRDYDARIKGKQIKGPDAQFDSVDEWADDVVEDIKFHVEHAENSKLTESIDAIAFLAGKDYRIPVMERLEEFAADHDILMLDPFDGTSGFGDQIGLLTDDNERLAAGEPSEIMAAAGGR